MSRVPLIAVLVLMAVPALAGTPHAPLPPALMAAKTIFIQNNSGHADITDKCYDQLREWGRFQVVNDSSQADVIFEIGTHSRSSGANGTIIGDHVWMTENHAHYTTISVLDQRGNVLWTDTRKWGFKSATRGVIKELRKRIEEQE